MALNKKQYLQITLFLIGILIIFLTYFTTFKKKGDPLEVSDVKKIENKELDESVDDLNSFEDVEYRGIANGKVANDITDISSLAVSAKFCLLSSRFSKTISKATTTRNIPPIILNELIFTPIISSKAPPTKEKNNKIKKDINVALR